MIKQKEINMLNVDDYIRERKRLSREKNMTPTRFFWRKKNLKYIRKFAQAILSGLGYKAPKNYPIGYTFMGVKHFISKCQ